MRGYSMSALCANIMEKKDFVIHIILENVAPKSDVDPNY